MKDSFLLPKSLKNIYDELNDMDVAKLSRGIADYANGLDSGLDGYLKVIFLPIKERMDKNEERYEETCKRNRENGRLGGRPKKEELEENPVGFSKTKENPKKPIYHNHNHIHNSYITNHNSNINNQDNINNSNNLEKIEYEEEEPLKADDTGLLAETFKEVISYLNLKTGSNYRYNTNSTTTRIKARLNEGFKLDDFIDVIDKKCADWLNTDMEKYLRPETLFGTKFESYLNQPARPKKLKDISFEELEEMSKWEKQNF